ncbi:MAG: type II toxin-antitoxin system VapC family toxin [Spirochaetales bacterium]|nr:type II toxin-antitoxin system VapC family toxin [Spirochaetales bacterium]
MYCLDTNICIYYLKGLYPGLKSRLLLENPGNIRIPSIVKAELLYGAEKSRLKEENLELIRQFLFPLEILDFGSRESEEYSLIRAFLESKGQVIGPNDLLIAATAKASNAILITHNTGEFSRVPDLKIEDWTL